MASGENGVWDLDLTHADQPASAAYGELSGDCYLQHDAVAWEHTGPDLAGLGLSTSSIIVGGIGLATGNPLPAIVGIGLSAASVWHAFSEGDEHEDRMVTCAVDTWVVRVPWGETLDPAELKTERCTHLRWKFSGGNGHTEFIAAGAYHYPAKQGESNLLDVGDTIVLGVQGANEVEATSAMSSFDCTSNLWITGPFEGNITWYE